jgi:hypothetical protein
MNEFETTLLRDHSGTAVIAQVLPRLDASAIRTAELSWRAHMRLWRIRAAWDREFAEALPQHIQWDWRRKAKRFLPRPEYQIIGLSHHNEMQGMMVLRADAGPARHPDNRGKTLAYVEYLSVAPWNLPLPKHPPRYRGGGTALLLAAIKTSIVLGYDGRLALHSLPQSEQFYNRLGFADLGLDPDYHSLRYFELGEDQAALLHSAGGTP